MKLARNIYASQHGGWTAQAHAYALLIQIFKRRQPVHPLYFQIALVNIWKATVRNQRSKWFNYIEYSNLHQNPYSG